MHVCLSGGFLKKELVEGETFFFLPVVVWKVFTSWYGTAGLQGGPALPRLVQTSLSYGAMQHIVNLALLIMHM